MRLEVCIALVPKNGARNRLVATVPILRLFLHGLKTQRHKELCVIENATPEVCVEEIDRVSSLRGKGVFLLSRHAEVLHCSPFARAHLERGDWPVSVAGGNLLLNDSSLHSKFVTYLGEVADDFRVTSGMLLDAGQGRLRLCLGMSKSVVEHIVVVTIRDPEWSSDDDQEHLQQLFTLTQREAELATYLSTGKTLSQFAENQFLTINTVKSHLKQVFKKTGVQSQMQLVAVVLSALK